MLMMAARPVELTSRVVFSPNLIKQEFVAVQTMENLARPPLVVQTTKCHLTMRAINAQKWVLDFVQKTNCLTKYVVAREEAVIAI